MSHVIVIGGGPAGMMAAIAAAEKGHKVDLYEKNEKLGKKLFITGKGRCNVTNDCDTDTLFANVCSNPRFLYSAFAQLNSQDVIRFFEDRGMPTKTERGGRVFPVSDHSSDVIRTLQNELSHSGVKVHLNEEVIELITEKTEAEEEPEATEAAQPSVNDKYKKKAKKTGPTGKIRGIVLKGGSKVQGDAVIIATGGLSYKTTGSTGDGLKFARESGHRITDCSPSLVPMETAGPDAPCMQGLSLKNVKLKVLDGKKVLYDDFGEMMFTHFGITGPLVLTASTRIQKQLKKGPLEISIDLKPALDEQQFDARLLREFEAASNKQFHNILGNLYPAKMIPVMIARSGIDEHKPVRDITKAERKKLIEETKNFRMTVTGLRDYKEAIITKGGVNVKDVDPGTMESKVISGLYFAGEVLDLDAVTGGFNLQIAWATGHAAGSSVGQK